MPCLNAGRGLPGPRSSAFCRGIPPGVSPAGDAADSLLKPIITSPPRPATNPDFFFTDQMLATNRPTWDDINDEGPNAIHFCPNAVATLTNGTSKTMHLKGSNEGDVSWNIGSAKPDQTITFNVGNEIGAFNVSSLDDGLPLAGYRVVQCDAKGREL